MEFTVKDFKVSGVAAPYGKRSNDLGGFYEVIDFGAFESILATNPSVKAVLDHSTESLKTLGTTENGTLQLFSTERGLEFNLDVAQTTSGKDALELLKRKDLSKMSFAFVVDQDVWDNINGETIRTIKSFRALNDVSIVSYPAYNDTLIN